MKSNENIIYDSLIGEVLVHVESTGRAFVFKLHTNYPSSSWRGITLLKIESSSKKRSNDEDNVEEYQVLFLVKCGVPA